MNGQQSHNTYFFNRQPFFQKQNDLTTYAYTCQFNPNSTLTALFQDFTVSLGKQTQLSQFLNNLSNMKKGKKTDVFDMFVIIFKEFLAFLSFIETHTTRHQRSLHIYNKDQCKFYIKWQEGQIAKGSNSQDTNSSLCSTVNGKRMVIMLNKVMNEENCNSTIQQGEVNASEITDQGGVMQKYIQSFLNNHKEDLSVLKGKMGTFYILYLKQTMGKGGFGQVCRGESVKLTRSNEIQCETWAIKACKKNINQYKQYGYSISQQRQHEILQQINRNLKKRDLKGGRNIIQLREVIDQRDRKYIVYEYCQHNSLREMTKKNNKLSKKNIFEIALQLASVMKLIHYQLIQTQQDFLGFSVKFSNDIQVKDDNVAFEKVQNRQRQAKGIIHRDIKLNNILVKQFSRNHIVIKLIDWAFSKRTFTNLKLSKVSCGTLQYQAPELQQKMKYDSKVDVWAYGAVVYELLTGRQFAEKGRKDAKKNFQNYINDMVFSQISETFSNEEMNFWKELLLGTLQYTPENRWSSIDICRHLDSFKGYQNFQLKDYSQLARVRQAKGVMMYHLSVAAQQFKEKHKFVGKAFTQYSKLLVQATQSLAERQIQNKVDLEDEQIKQSQKEFNFETQQKIVKQKCSYLLIGQSVAFFQQNLSQNYKRKSEFVSCIKYLQAQFKKIHMSS